MPPWEALLIDFRGFSTCQADELPIRQPIVLAIQGVGKHQDR